MKITPAIKLAESLSPITKNRSEVKEFTQELGEIVKESNTPQLAIENNNNTLPIENEQLVSGVIYDTSLENTLSKMKRHKGFFNLEGRYNGDIVWNGFPVEKIGGNKLKINEKIYKISDDLQIVFTNTSNIPLKKLNDRDREIYKNSLKELILRSTKQYVVKLFPLDINILKATLRTV